MGVHKRRDASSRTLDNANAMSRVADIRDASSQTSDNGGCLVPGGGQAGIRREDVLSQTAAKGGEGGRLVPGGPQRGRPWPRRRTADDGEASNLYIIHILK